MAGLVMLLAAATKVVFNGSYVFVGYSLMVWTTVILLSIVLYDLTHPLSAQFLYKRLRYRNGTLKHMPRMRLYKSVCALTILMLLISLPILSFVI